MANDDLRFRKMNLNDPVTITLPAYIAIGFLFAYSECTWNNMCASKIAVSIQNQVLDPVYLKEQEAQIQAQADMHHAAFSHMMGQPMEVPPNISDVGPFGLFGISRENPDEPES